MSMANAIMEQVSQDLKKWEDTQSPRAKFEQVDLHTKNDVTVERYQATDIIGTLRGQHEGAEYLIRMARDREGNVRITVSSRPGPDGDWQDLYHEDQSAGAATPLRRYCEALR